jgi:hypothetical protein
MRRLLLNLVVFLGSAAIGLAIAAAVLDSFSITATSFIVDVVIFAVLQLVLSRLIPRHLVLGAVGLASTFVALLLTNLISSGLTIKGVGTWILATLIVWVVTMLASWALSRWVRPNQAAPHRSR